MDRIAAHLFDIGYQHASAKVYISRLGRFSEFVARYTRVGKIDQNVIDLFMRSLQAGSPRIAARTAIEHRRDTLTVQLLTLRVAALRPMSGNGLYLGVLFV